MAHLSQIKLVNRGDISDLVCRDLSGKSKLLRFVWMDRERRYFISSASSQQEGTPYTRKRRRQVNEEENLETDSVDMIIPQPTTAKIYYDVCKKIYQHNCHRQETLKLEVKLQKIISKKESTYQHLQ